MIRIQTFESKVMAVWIFQEFWCSILTISIYYSSQSDIRVKSYDSLNLLGASVINFEGLDILWSTIRHLSPKLCQFEFARSFRVQFRASPYIMVRNQIFKSKVMVVWSFAKHKFSIFFWISQIWLHQVFLVFFTQNNSHSDTRSKSYGRLKFW